MSRRILAASVAFILMGLASAAHAQTFSPTGSSSGAGTITTGPVTCDVIVAGSASPTAIAFPTRILSPGHVACGSAMFPTGSWSVQRIPGSTTTVNLTLGIVNIIANCSGSVVANWDNSTSTVSFANAVFGPAVPQCTYTGSINLPDLQLL